MEKEEEDGETSRPDSGLWRRLSGGHGCFLHPLPSPVKHAQLYTQHKHAVRTHNTSHLQRDIAQGWAALVRPRPRSHLPRARLGDARAEVGGASALAGVIPGTQVPEVSAPTCGQAKRHRQALKEGMDQNWQGESLRGQGERPGKVDLALKAWPASPRTFSLSHTVVLLSLPLTGSLVLSKPQLWGIKSTWGRCEVHRTPSLALSLEGKRVEVGREAKGERWRPRWQGIKEWAGEAGDGSGPFRE